MSRKCGSLFSLPLAVMIAASRLFMFGHPQSPPRDAAPVYNANELSCGLYWFGLHGANQKFVSGQANPYFDRTRPTLIFVHGWQPFLSMSLPSFDFLGTDTAAAWIQAGWNVGIYVWNQFSDETTGVASTTGWFGSGPPPQGVLDAEAKVWTTNGPHAMRWRDWNDTGPFPIPDGYSPAPADTPSAAELFCRTYIAAMTDQAYTGGVIRIAGHSLGNQMAVRLAQLLDTRIAAGELPEGLRPARVALLDPYWSPDPRNDLPDSDAAGRRTGDVIRQYIAQLIPSGILFEWYRSSNWTRPPQGDANEALQPMTFYAELNPAYALEELDRHLAAQHLYFWSYAFDGPAPCAGEGCLGMTRTLSKMANDQLAAVLRSDYRWIQDAGQATSPPDDDTYHPVLHSGAPYTVVSVTAIPACRQPGGTAVVTAAVPAPDGTLVTFASDLGRISPRVTVMGGLASARLGAGIAGTAHVTATTRGSGGTVQGASQVVFSNVCPVYLPLVLK